MAALLAYALTVRLRRKRRTLIAVHAIAATPLLFVGLALLTVFYGTSITAIFTIVTQLPAASSMVALNFEPIAALFLGWLVLGQTVAPVQIAGAFLVVGAIVYVGAGRH